MADPLIQLLLEGDIIGFIIACYTLRIGQLFYVIVTMIGSVTLYNRLETIFPCAILWLLLGGTFLALMPVISPFAILLTILGLAGLVYKAYTGMTGS